MGFQFLLTQTLFPHPVYPFRLELVLQGSWALGDLHRPELD